LIPLNASDRLQRALDLAYRHLNRRDRTVGEMRRHLARHGIESDATEAAIQELSEQGYLDDARFARLFAEDKRSLEHWGSDRIKRSLLERGVDRDLIESVLANADAGNGEHERALELLRHRFPSPPRDRRDRDRALGVLIRKGYDGDVALDVLAAYSRRAGRPELQ
jgi:regulatory protein